MKRNKQENQDPIKPNIRSAIKLAKRKHNILEFTIQAEEFEPAFTEPSNNISYSSRDGYSSEDISGYCIPESWSHYLKVIKDNFKEAKKDDGLLQAISFSRYDLLLPWQRWIWTLHSTQYIAHEIVENTYGPKVKKKKADKEYYYKHHDRLISEVTKEQVLEYLDKNYKKINDNIWVSPSDYGDFYYNHFNKPYELKDGWSLRQVSEIMKEWLKNVMNEEMDVCHVRR